MVAFFTVLSLAAGTLLGYAFVVHDRGTAEYASALLVLSIAAARLTEKTRQRSAYGRGHK